MRKSEIETYMNAFMDGFWQCYDMMMDMIDDDELELTQVNQEPESSEIKPETAEKPPVVDKPTKPKTEPKAEPKQPKTEPKQAKKDSPTHDQFVELFKEGKLPTDVAKELGVSPATAYNHLNKARQEGEL